MTQRRRLQDQRLGGERAAAGRRRAGGGAVRSEQAGAGHRLASVDVSARDRAAGLVAISLWFGNQKVREANQFNYHAIVEVAALFSGIFITMQPALQILSVRGDELGIHTPAQFFWATGSAVERARQRADVPGVLQDGPGDADADRRDVWWRASRRRFSWASAWGPCSWGR